MRELRRALRSLVEGSVSIRLMDLRRHLRRRRRNRDRVRFRPERGAARQVQTMHGDLDLAAIDFHLQVVVVHILTLERIVRRAFDRISVRSRAAGHKISDPSVLVTFVVMHVSGENNHPGAEVLLAGFQCSGKFVLLGAGGVSSSDIIRIRRTGVGRMVHNDENEFHVARKVVQLLGEPLPLRTGELIERTIQHEHERVGGADGIVAALLYIRETLEVVVQGNAFIAVKIVVADRGVNRNLFLAPHCGFTIPHLPIVVVVAVIDDVAAEGDKRRIGLGNPAFISFGGDIVYNGYDNDDWKVWDSETAVWREKKIPVYPAIGNHDLHGNEGVALDNYFQRFPDIKKSRYYSVRAANTLMLVLDSSLDELSGPQGQWLAQKLDYLPGDVEFVFIVMHHPPYTSSSDANNIGG